jgi:hypothetical protein
LTLSQSIENLQHFEISFDGENLRKIGFGNFETSPVTLVTYYFKIEHAISKAMVHSTCVPILVSIEAFSYSFIEVVTGGFSM